MDKFFAAIRDNLSRIADPSGRESNIQFWPYAVLVAALNYIAGSLVAAPILNAMLQQLVHIIAEPEKHVGTIEPFAFMPDMRALVVPHAIILFVTIVLLFSAVARRLHDRDRTGLWGLMPVPFAACGFAFMPYVFAGFDDGGPDPTLFMAMMLNNFIYLGSLVLLIVLLVGKGTAGPNRFGPPTQ